MCLAPPKPLSPHSPHPQPHRQPFTLPSLPFPVWKSHPPLLPTTLPPLPSLHPPPPSPTPFPLPRPVCSSPSWPSQQRRLYHAPCLSTAIIRGVSRTQVILIGRTGFQVMYAYVQEVFRQRKGIGLPFGLQLHGKTLGIIGMGQIG